MSEYLDEEDAAYALAEREKARAKKAPPAKPAEKPVFVRPPLPVPPPKTPNWRMTPKEWADAVAKRTTPQGA